MAPTRGLALALALAACATLLAAPAAGERAAPTRVSTLDHQLLGRLNAVRARHELRPLRLSRGLSAAAASHSLEMARDGYFAHASANGLPFWRRLERFYPPARYRRWLVGENLLWESPDVTAAQAIRLWLASPPHRANLLDPAFREIGIAAVSADAAPGTYRGLPVTILTTDFGARTN
jgi:uncharacterized protein YkwD